MYADEIEQANAELWQALDALETGNLTYARSYTARAQSAIVNAWRSRNEEVSDEQRHAILERR